MTLLRPERGEWHRGGRSACGRAVDADLSLVRLDQPFRRREAKPRAARLGCEERSEDLVVDIGLDSRSVVRDRDLAGAVSSAYRHLHAPASGKARRSRFNCPVWTDLKLQTNRRPLNGETSATAPPPLAPALIGLKILLLDDEEDTLLMFRDALEEAGRAGSGGLERHRCDRGGRRVAT
jgi:hypothetical protein